MRVASIRVANNFFAGGEHSRKSPHHRIHRLRCQLEVRYIRHKELITRATSLFLNHLFCFLLFLHRAAWSGVRERRCESEGVSGGPELLLSPRDAEDPHSAAGRRGGEVPSQVRDRPLRFETREHRVLHERE
jgi:hypothetical protein